MPDNKYTWSVNAADLIAAQEQIVAGNQKIIESAGQAAEAQSGAFTPPRRRVGAGSGVATPAQANAAAAQAVAANRRMQQSMQALGQTAPGVASRLGSYQKQLQQVSQATQKTGDLTGMVGRRLTSLVTGVIGGTVLRTVIGLWGDLQKQMDASVQSADQYMKLQSMLSMNPASSFGVPVTQYEQASDNLAQVQTKLDAAFGAPIMQARVARMRELTSAMNDPKLLAGAARLGTVASYLDAGAAVDSLKTGFISLINFITQTNTSASQLPNTLNMAVAAMQTLGTASSNVSNIFAQMKANAADVSNLTSDIDQHIDAINQQQTLKQRMQSGTGLQNSLTAARTQYQQDLLYAGDVHSAAGQAAARRLPIDAMNVAQQAQGYTDFIASNQASDQIAILTDLKSKAASLSAQFPSAKPGDLAPYLQWYAHGTGADKILGTSLSTYARLFPLPKGLPPGAPGSSTPGSYVAPNFRAPGSTSVPGSSGPLDLSHVPISINPLHGPNLRTVGGGGFGGGRASGGAVNPWTTYLVGERGPEYLTMGSRGGAVTPGGTTQVQVVCPDCQRKRDLYNLEHDPAYAKAINRNLGNLARGR